MLDHITPVILTFNEEPNIRRTLAALDWATRIVVVDSGSTDSTLAILAEDPRINVFSRRFDTHGHQWEFALNGTNISTDWVLRLDADYIVTRELRDEIAQLDPDAPFNAYRIGFDYLISGRRLRASLYPAKTVLFRRAQVTAIDRGHTEVWVIRGQVGELRGRIWHDDRKSVAAWIISQARYVTREFSLLASNETRSLSLALRVRPPLMPLLSFLYCLFFKGLIFNGRAGLFYSLQRLLVETALALVVLEDRMKSRNDSPPMEEE
jgi:glycosyltransferase involved in cell wall biosynthesis